MDAQGLLGTALDSRGSKYLTIKGDTGTTGTPGTNLEAQGIWNAVFDPATGSLNVVAR